MKVTSTDILCDSIVMCAVTQDIGEKFLMHGLKNIFPKKHPWFHIKLDTFITKRREVEPTDLSNLYNSKTDIYMSIEEASEFLINHAHEMTVTPQEVTQ